MRANGLVDILESTGDHVVIINALGQSLIQIEASPLRWKPSLLFLPQTRYDQEDASIQPTAGHTLALYAFAFCEPPSAYAMSGINPSFHPSLLSAPLTALHVRLEGRLVSLDVVLDTPRRASLAKALKDDVLNNPLLLPRPLGARSGRDGLSRVERDGDLGELGPVRMHEGHVPHPLDDGGLVLLDELPHAVVASHAARDRVRALQCRSAREGGEDLNLALALCVVELLVHVVPVLDLALERLLGAGQA